MGSPVVTRSPSTVQPGRDITRMRRTGFWTTVVGVLLTFVGAVTVLLVRGDPGRPSAVRTDDQPPVTATVPGGGPATTTVTVPAVRRPPGTIAPGAPGAPPAIPVPADVGPPPATPQEVAELLASLPLQLEQAATSDGQPRELPPEEVDKMVQDLLRQLGAQP